MGAKKKTPKIGASLPTGGKQVRVDPTATPDWFGMHIAWHFRSLDHEGPFGWGCCDRATLIDTIINRARDFETMTWRELQYKDLLHSTPLQRIAKEARERLEEINQGDVAELHSLRIEKKRRVWGIRDRLYFRVLWWDPEHDVYPMNIKDN